jgi:hypothetical protein
VTIFEKVRRFDYVRYFRCSDWLSLFLSRNSAKRRSWDFVRDLVAVWSYAGLITCRKRYMSMRVVY